MFSGIVERKARIEVLDLAEKWGRLALRVPPWEPPLAEGESIAVQGICLTLARIENGLFGFDILRETFECTTLGEKTVGRELNLERSLRWGDTMGGHIVVGHVDGVGRVRTIGRAGRDWTYEITCDRELLDGLVYKGSVSVDGVSLTVADLRDDSFTVHIIPYTWEETTFGSLREGDGVNLEVDLLSKYVRRLMEKGRILPEVSWEQLRAEGFITDDAKPATG